MKTLMVVLFGGLLLFSASGAQAGESRRIQDPAWDFYAKSQKQIQVAYHHLVRLYLHDLKDTVLKSQELQLAQADQQNERYYFLAEHHPERIIRNQGFNAFVNFPWTEEDEALLLAGNKGFQKRQKQIDKLKEKLDQDPGYKRILDKLRALSGDVEYRKIHTRFRFVPRDVETLLSGQSLPEAENTF